MPPLAPRGIRSKTVTSLENSRGFEVSALNKFLTQRGMRVAEITTRIVRVIEVPRSQLADFLKLPEAQQVGVYFLMGELSEARLPRAYIGQSGNVGTRLVQHNQNKDFWNRAMVVISLTNSMTQTHALFLEWFAIAEATKAGRYSLENGNTGSQPYTPAPLQADCHEIHGTAATLLATLGQPIFEPLTNAPTAKGEKELFFCKGSGADGVGEYTTEGFVVLKGSKGRIENVAVMMGRSANGWVEWKAANGKTLDELKRQTVSANG